MRGLKLEIQPIPQGSWGYSLANKLPKEEWDKLRRKTYEKAGYRCEVCEGGGVLHSHEVWHFDDKRNIQKLVGLVCVCKLCHDVIHFGRSIREYSMDYIDKLIKHWCKVNGKTLEDFLKYKDEVFRINSRRADKMYSVKVGRKVLA